jgi:copper chaperone CopZ
MKHLILELENLDCEGCANSIRRSLLRQPGVLSVHVGVKAAQIQISCEDDLDRAHVLSVLENMGFPTLGRNTMLNMARAKLSCELGKIRHRAYSQPLMS